MFSISLQWTLSILTILSFINYYIVQTSDKTFLEELRKSKSTFLGFAIVIPILVNLLNILNKQAYYNIFQPPNNRFQVMELFAPIIAIILSQIFFTYMTIQKQIGGSVEFRNNYIYTLITSLSLQFITYITFSIIIVMAQFIEMDLAYRISLLLLNTQVLQFMYQYGLNPIIMRVAVLQLSRLIPIGSIQDTDASFSKYDISIISQEVPSKIPESPSSQDHYVVSTTPRSKAHKSAQLNEKSSIELGDRALSTKH
ncbi:hypothetical protein pb186bvf_002518 [Paramecium bursaria]